MAKKIASAPSARIGIKVADAEKQAWEHTRQSEVQSLVNLGTGFSNLMGLLEQAREINKARLQVENQLYRKYKVWQFIQPDQPWVIDQEGRITSPGGSQLSPAIAENHHEDEGVPEG